MSVGSDPPLRDRKPLVFLASGVAIKSPPFKAEARREAGVLLGRLQVGETIGMPHSRPMPSIGPRCHELRIRDAAHYWRIMYRIDPDAILVIEVFPKGTRKTPLPEIRLCQNRLAAYDAG